MRTLAKNKQKLYYSLFDDSAEQYEKNPDGTTKYITIDGVSVPVEVGTQTNSYAKPVGFKANIAFGGDSDIQTYGISIGDYDAIVVTDKNKYPIKESSLIWFETTPVYLDPDEKIVDPKSADYTVKAAVNTLNYSKFVLKRRVKDES